MDAYDRGVVLDVQIIWAGSSVGSSSGLKIHVSRVQVPPGPPTAAKQHPLHKMHDDVGCKNTGLVYVSGLTDVHLGFYAIHKPTRRNPKEKHTNSASRM